MAPKRATFLCYGNDDICGDVRKFIEEAGVIIDARDLAENPLTEVELDRLVGTLNVAHFVNSLAPAYAKMGWDKGLPSREEVIEAMAKDHTLIRRPIVKSSRLITIGADKKRISDMLQLGQSNNDAPENPRPSQKGSNNRRSHKMASTRSSR